MIKVEEVVRQYVTKKTVEGNLYHRESAQLEYKESFGHKSWGSYLKCIAAFANNKGGVIVFGVKDKPNTPKGLNKDIFEAIDPAEMTKHLQDHFDPEIEYEIGVIEADNKWFGFFYVEESKTKPIICKKNAGKELTDGNIYYRYRGRSEKIKHAELKKIINENKKQEEENWFDLLKNISLAGVANAHILNLKEGTIGDNIVLDQKAIEQIKFIKEGEFNEITGAPTLKLIGEINGENIQKAIFKEKEVIVIEDLDKTHPYTKKQIFNDLKNDFPFLKQHYLNPFLFDQEVKNDKNMYRPFKQGKSTFHRFSEKMKQKIKTDISNKYNSQEKLKGLSRGYQKNKAA